MQIACAIVIYSIKWQGEVWHGVEKFYLIYIFGFTWCELFEFLICAKLGSFCYTHLYFIFETISEDGYEEVNVRELKRRQRIAEKFVNVQSWQINHCQILKLVEQWFCRQWQDRFGKVWLKNLDKLDNFSRPFNYVCKLLVPL